MCEFMGMKKYNTLSLEKNFMISHLKSIQNTVIRHFPKRYYYIRYWNTPIIAHTTRFRTIREMQIV